MIKSDAYQVQHISLEGLLRQGFSDPVEGCYYRVYWWDSIPLGHRWMEEAGNGKPYKKQESDLVWECIGETLRFYCSGQETIDFNTLRSHWKKEDFAFCLNAMRGLFSVYEQQHQTLHEDVSLVICTRNRTTQLKSCLDSLTDLNSRPAEVLVVDNAPDDEQTKFLVAQYPGVKYLLEPEKGLDKARNTGWRYAGSSIVAYTDDDVRLHCDWVWQVARAFDHPRVKAVTGLVFAEELDTEAQVIFEKHWPFNRGYVDIYYGPGFFRKHLPEGVPAWDVGAGAGMAFRRDILQALGGFDPRLDVGAAGCSGDSEMWYRLMAAGWIIHYAPLAIAYHTHRRELKALKRQIYHYMRGAAASMLIQYQRYRHRGNLRHLFRRLPAYYLHLYFWGFRSRFSGRHVTLFREVAGCVSGIFYFMKHRNIKVERQTTLFYKEMPQEPLISVIITTYNHERYLPDAIESVLHQTFLSVELIVVDDGSTDNTEGVIAHYPQVRYIKQANRGLASARNTGIFNSRGDYLVFLDADDLLYPAALSVNLKYFRRHAGCAFISGGHDRVDEDKKLMETYESKPPAEAHYQALLRGNYIGMHAAVMYRREVFERYLFDETLPACEDYDLYLRIAKDEPVFSHGEKLAAYRIHGSNMSNNVSLMLEQAKKVLRKNYAAEESHQVYAAYREGKKNWKEYYAREIYRRMAYRYLYPYYKINSRDARLVIATMPWQVFKLSIHKVIDKGSNYFFIKASRMLKMLKRRKGDQSFMPAPGKIRMGDLRRTIPFSEEFGYDRGGPVDRYYIESFLGENADCIYGRVLEIGDNDYTLAFGGDRVTKSDVLHVEAANPKATFTGDLSQADFIPAEQFDCIILTQTLQFIYDFREALRHCHRLLKPGGTLLLTVPGITQIQYGEWDDTWYYWSFTGKAIQKLLSEFFDPTEVKVRTHGNVLAATAFLYGMGMQELSREEKDEHDPRYQLVITASVQKSKAIQR